MKKEGLAKIINENKEDIVFLIGNGIHRYANHNNLSWEDLLLDLWNKYSSNQISKIPNGISYPEFYDAMELEVLQSLNNKELLKRIESRLPSKLTKYNIGNGIEEIIKLSRKLSFCQSELSSGYDLKLLELIGFHGNQQEQRELLSEIKKRLSYKSIKSLALQLIKEQLCETMKGWTASSSIMKMIRCIDFMNIPVFIAVH